MKLPTPHLEKLRATLENDKLPKDDVSAIENAIVVYGQWVSDLSAVKGADNIEIATKMVSLLNDYRLYLDVDVIFDREADFLYRQKGQIKLDNSVIEEFLPHLVYKCIVEGSSAIDIVMGSTTTFSSIYFASSLHPPTAGGGLTVRTKDQDFAIARPLHVLASHDNSFPAGPKTIRRSFNLGYVMAECKTNLDKTMFQEAVATAHDSKSAVTGCKYYLLCEWLDMTPQSTVATDIDEVIILRKQKRLSSNIRSAYGSYAGRKNGRQRMLEFLQANPFNAEMFMRFITHIEAALEVPNTQENEVLRKGYF